jgi:hypothetical protein
MQASRAICDILATNVGIVRKSGFQGQTAENVRLPPGLADNILLPLVACSGQAPVQLIGGAHQGEVGKRLGIDNPWTWEKTSHQTKSLHDLSQGYPSFHLQSSGDISRCDP